jgi:predicted PurR-regulated permease PerM
VWLLGLIATVLVGWVLHVGAPILLPLVVAFLLAGMIAPIVRRAALWRIPAFVTVVAMMSLIFFGLLKIAFTVRDNFAQFVGDPEAAAESGQPGLGWDEIVTNLDRTFQESAMPEALSKMLMEALRKVDPKELAEAGLVGGLGFVSDLVLVMIYMIFIFAESRLFQRKILAIAGERRDRARAVLQHISWGIQRYLLIKTLISFLIGLLCYLILVFLNVPYAALLGLLTFLLHFIPTFGIIIAGTLASLVALAAGDTWTVALWTALGYLAVSTVLGNYLDPKILGRELNLSPLVIVVSVVVWAGIWGVAGAFLAVPITSALQVILLSEERTRSIAILLSGSPPKEPKEPLPE